RCYAPNNCHIISPTPELCSQYRLHTNNEDYTMKKLIAAPLMGLAALLSGCDSTNTTSETSNSTAAAVSSPAAETTARFTQFVYQGESQEKVTVGEGEFRNPILSGYAPDPTVARVGDDYYVVPSTFTHFPGLPIYHSKDLV